MSEELQFPSVKTLEQWLQEQGLEPAAWGRKGSKRVSDLWNEIQKGETRLEADPPMRFVEVVRVIVRRNGRVLIEEEQMFSDGRMRTRNRPPSEKLYPGEDPLLAAERCLMEELGADSDAIRVYADTYRVQEVQSESASYPGLQSCYCFHIVDAAVQGLPETRFSTEEQAVGPGEPVSRHFWGWRQVGAVPIDR